MDEEKDHHGHGDDRKDEKMGAETLHGSPPSRGARRLRRISIAVPVRTMPQQSTASSGVDRPLKRLQAGLVTATRCRLVGLEASFTGRLAWLHDLVESDVDEQDRAWEMFSTDPRIPRAKRQERFKGLGGCLGADSQAPGVCRYGVAR
jgi:hypothetical protein